MASMRSDEPLRSSTTAELWPDAPSKREKNNRRAQRRENHGPAKVRRIQSGRKRMRRIVALCVGLLSATVSVALAQEQGRGSLGPLPTVQDKQQSGRQLPYKGGIKAIERLTERWSAVEADATDGLMLMSTNGRFVMKGEVIDTWTGRRLKSVNDIRDALNHLDLERLRLKVSDLGPLTFGRGSKRVTVWVDPTDDTSQDLLRQLRALEDRFTFDLLVVPLHGGSEALELTRVLSCAKDTKGAVDALLRGDMQPALDEDPRCDRGAIQRRFIATELLTVTAAPFSIAPDGRVLRGLNSDYAAWLEGRS